MAFQARSSRRSSVRNTNTAKSARRDLFQSLEHRQLMAVTSAQFNFQPTNSPVPSGYIADNGKTFRSQNGLQYGWTLDNSKDTRDRNTSLDGRLDTLVQFNNSKWEVAVPNGSYEVALTAGDASYTDSKYAIALEGKTVLNGTPSSSKKFIDATALVSVTDGRLTLSSAAGHANNKIVSLSLSAVDVAGGASLAKPSAPTWISSWSDTTNTAYVKWNDTSKNESGFIIERSLDNKGWTEVGRVGANATSFTATGLNANTKYYFRVKSYNAAGTSGISPVEFATTLKAATPSTPSTPSNTKPSAVSGLTVTVNGPTTATVSWNDVSNETGYTVQRSTDNKSFSNVATLGANVTSYADKSLKASTKYYYRITAVNAVGSSTSAVSSATTGVASTPSTPNVPSTPAHPSGSSLAGINANGGDVNSNKSALRDLGVSTVRIAMKSGWSMSAASGWYADQARQYKAAGFKVMLIVMPTTATDYNTAKKFFSNLANSDLKSAVDYWQIGNEPNISKFWNSSAQTYVNNMLKPAYEALHAVGETVVGAGPSWDPNYCKQLVSLGYNNYVDYAAFHPYGNGAAECISRAQGAKAAFGNKPVMFTEWSVSGYENNAAKWASENAKVAAALSNLGPLSFYYCLRVDSSRTGAGGALTSGGSKNGPFYDAVKNWIN